MDVLYMILHANTYNSDTAAGAELIAPTGGVLKNFANFTGKHLCWSLLFTKLQTFRIATLLKKRPLHMCFPVKFEKF